ncbi:putative 5'(3')-deoxyribonucleotidase [compost metagenome]
MSKKRIAVDQDGVIADLLTEWVGRYNYDYNDNIKPNQVTAWNWSHICKPECGNKIYSYMDDPDLFESLPVINYSQEVLQELNDIYDIYIVTAPFNMNNVAAKHSWLRRHFPFLDPDKFVFTRDKGIVRANYLIDDKPSNLDDFLGDKLLFSAPHNQTESRFYRVNNWQDIRRYFLKEHLEFNTFDKARLVENEHTKLHHYDQIGKSVDILKRIEGEFDYMVMMANGKVDYIKAKDIEKL